MPAARQQIVRQLPRRSVGAEIGVWKGSFSALLLQELDPRCLHLVDPWAFQADAPDAWYGGAQATSQDDMDAIHDGVARRFRRQVRKGTVVIHRADSARAAEDFGAGELDWVYIDGDHRYEAVRRELELYSDRVGPGGIIAGDDYHDAGWWNGGVKRAVDEWTPTADLLEFTVIGSQFLARLEP